MYYTQALRCEVEIWPLKAAKNLVKAVFYEEKLDKFTGEPTEK